MDKLARYNEQSALKLDALYVEDCEAAKIKIKNKRHAARLAAAHWGRIFKMVSLSNPPGFQYSYTTLGHKSWPLNIAPKYCALCQFNRYACNECELGREFPPCSFEGSPYRARPEPWSGSQPRVEKSSRSASTPTRPSRNAKMRSACC